MSEQKRFEWGMRDYDPFKSIKGIYKKQVNYAKRE